MLVYEVHTPPSLSLMLYTTHLFTPTIIIQSHTHTHTHTHD